MNEDEKAEVVINAMYFITNYPMDFIQRCWADNPGMMKWFTDKFLYYYETYGCVAGPVHFFLYLGSGHQETLAKWINENYSHKMK
jgi:hypothetical protein